MKNLPLFVQEYRRLRSLKIPPKQALDLAAFYVPVRWSMVGAAAGLLAAAIVWAVTK